MDKIKILIIEDDRSMRECLKKILVENNYEVSEASDIHSALFKINDMKISMYIIDIKLPDGEGIFICKTIRERNMKPILFLTAFGDESHIYNAFENGGDDYLVKPFHIKEFILRVKALLRRNQNEKVIQYQSGPLCFSVDTSEVECLNEILILTNIEYKILLLLVMNNYCIISREKIALHLSMDNSKVMSDNVINVHICNLKHKLKKVKACFIITKKGFGYVWNYSVDKIMKDFL